MTPPAPEDPVEAIRRALERRRAAQRAQTRLVARTIRRAVEVMERAAAADDAPAEYRERWKQYAAECRELVADVVAGAGLEDHDDKDGTGRRA